MKRINGKRRFILILSFFALLSVAFAVLFIKHVHSYESEIIKAAGCSEDGAVRYTCKCGDIYEEVTPAVGHNYVDGACTICGDEDAEHESIGLEFVSVGNGTCYVSGMGTCSDRNIVIPKNSPSGNRVVAIGEGAFMNANIDSVVLPSSVRTICTDAFWGSYIKNITIPDSVENIEYNAFFACESLEVSEYNDIYYLGNDNNPYYVLYYSYGDISSVNIHPDTKIIISLAFHIRTGIGEINIPDGVKSVCEMAFFGCTNLETVIIPSSVRFIGERAFDNTNLKTIYYAGTKDEWSSISVRTENSKIYEASCYYYSESEPDEREDAWCYVEGVPTLWKYIAVEEENQE